MPKNNCSECSAPVKAKGYCMRHYQRARRSDATALCAFGECDRVAKYVSLCDGHYAQQRRGVELRPLKQYAPRGSGHVLVTGYVQVKSPYADGPRQVLAHRLAMEEVLGRRLLPGENVHHKNGVRHDNRPENLELWVTHQPKGQRVPDLVAWAQEILRRYGDLPID